MLNRRQEKVIKLMKSGLTLFQRPNEGTAWYVWHPTAYKTKVNLTCRDVIDLVNKGLVTRVSHSDEERYLTDLGKTL